MTADPIDAGVFLRRVDAIAADVDGLVTRIVELREELEAYGVILPDRLAYRLATVLSRVDHAAAEIVLQQARQLVAEGQLEAFGHEALEEASDV